MPPVRQVGAQGEHIGEPPGEHEQLWEDFILLDENSRRNRTWPQAVVHVEPELQASPWPETPEPEPELDVEPPGHDDGHVPYLEERLEYYYDLGRHSLLYVCHYLPAPLMCVEFGWVWVEHQGSVTVATGGAHSR